MVHRGTDWQAKGTNWHQAREKSPWDRTNRDAMTRDYITTCSGQNEKSSLLAVWILPATGDNDIKYKLVFINYSSLVTAHGLHVQLKNSE